ncbi:MAG: UDP-N-acetylmuramoyl-L-alanyl-D-glutamate--2,6-diaminopimelate ligase [Deltaproteobacteria bacterium]|jgi:UDP-N-acetylmuramoyl-L-alanyl-D-glutamate--2,6-diaminopimelate ligase|nr:UDP-N-acetylmuramoyl-L-alanyl-D-glutamate--2,6-diaminopimelate ligase [Deltaproteobacteria bacterium]
MKNPELQELFHSLKLKNTHLLQKNIWQSRVQGITTDSRKIKPGYLFIAIKGQKTDGHNYLNQVHQKKGLAALVNSINPELQLPQIQVENTSSLWGPVFARYYGNPQESMKFIGITGTNGKTTTSYILEKILNDNGIKTGLIGTIEYRYGKTREPALFTSPQPDQLFPLLSRMKQAGVQAVLMETSSHALALQRYRTIKFDLALLTNFTQDHLDFHVNMDDYAAAKRLLFTQYLKPEGIAVAWAESKKVDFIIPQKIKPVTFGFNPSLHPNWLLTLDNLSIKGLKAHIKDCKNNKEYQIKSSLIGEHNLLNLAAALILAQSLGVDITRACSGITKLNIPGRLERVPGSIDVFVDYAHTPDALERVQLALKPLTEGRLITVFGCGGDRDALKRPIMGASVDNISDVSLVTSDNPRTEDPYTIIKDILPGIRSRQYSPEELEKIDRGHIVVTDRKEAIKTAIKHARKNDVVLIAGKGHEDYQIIGTIKHHFDDREIAAEFMEE